MSSRCTSSFVSDSSIEFTATKQINKVKVVISDISLGILLTDFEDADGEHEDTDDDGSGELTESPRYDVNSMIFCLMLCVVLCTVFYWNMCCSVSLNQSTAGCNHQNGYQNEASRLVLPKHVVVSLTLNDKVVLTLVS